MSDDARTWIGHAALVALAPPVLAWPWGTSRSVAVIAVLFALAFGVREWRNRRDKIQAGTWTERWKNDMVGDMLGPVVAAACYVIVWLT